MLDKGAGEEAEVGAFWEVLPDELVGVLDGALLPGGIGVGEIDGGVESPGDGLMVGELNAVVGGDGQDMPAEGGQQGHDRPGHRLRPLVEQGLDQDEVPGTLAEGEEGAPVVLPDDEIHLPVSEASAVGLGRAVVDADTSGDGPHRLTAAPLPLAVLEPVAAVRTQPPSASARMAL